MASEINTNPLFKYMSAEVAHITLVNSTLRWSSPVLFDDPLDVARVFDLGFPMEVLEQAVLKELDYIFDHKDVSHIQHNDLIKFITGFLNQNLSDEALAEFRGEIPDLLREGTSNSQKHIDELNTMWQKLIPEMRILCFSESKEVIPLWATYADNHKGVVMEFHPQAHTDSPWRRAQSVTYTNKPMSIATPEEWARSILGIEKFDYSKLFERYGCVKKEVWAYQQESRVFSFRREKETGNHSNYGFFPSDLKAIYLGYQSSADTVDTIRKLLDHDLKHVKLYQCRIDREAGKLVFDAL